MFISEGRKKILELFFKNPFNELHLRDIARQCGGSLSYVTECLQAFEKEKIFIKRKISNMVFFKPNMQSETLLKSFEYLELERKEKFYEANKKIARLLQKYTETIIDLSNKKIQLVILFGSVARGDWTRESDIDVLAVVPEKERETTAILNQGKKSVSSLLDIRPVSTTIGQFITGINNKTAFYNEMLKDRVVLYNEFLFWQLIKDGGIQNV